VIPLFLISVSQIGISFCCVSRLFLRHRSGKERQGYETHIDLQRVMVRVHSAFHQYEEWNICLGCS
jgi:hypothetical protein